MNYTIKDACTPRRGRDKTYWHKIGTAFVYTDGGISISFDSLPMPDTEGKCVVKVFDRKTDDAPARPARKAEQPVTTTGRGYAPQPSGIDDSEIPF